MTISCLLLYIPLTRFDRGSEYAEEFWGFSKVRGREIDISILFPKIVCWSCPVFICFIFKASIVVLPPLTLWEIIQSRLAISAYLCVCIWRSVFEKERVLQGSTSSLTHNKLSVISLCSLVFERLSENHRKKIRKWAVRWLLPLYVTYIFCG